MGFSALISNKCGVLMKLSIWHYCRRGLQEFIGLLGEMKLTLPGYYQVLQNCSGKGRYVSTFEAFEKLNIDNWFFSDQGRLDFKSINVCLKALWGCSAYTFTGAKTKCNIICFRNICIKRFAPFEKKVLRHMLRA